MPYAKKKCKPSEELEYDPAVHILQAPELAAPITIRAPQSISSTHLVSTHLVCNDTLIHTSIACLNPLAKQLFLTVNKNIKQKSRKSLHMHDFEVESMALSKKKQNISAGRMELAGINSRIPK